MEKIIMGIDPGTNVMGYAVVGVQNQKPRIVDLDAVKFNARESHYLRLRRIYERTLQLVDQYLPDELAIEAPFYGRNVQTTIKLGRGQGAAMVAVLSRDIPVTEYEPMKVKLAITGHGNASKEQVREMLRRTLGIDEEKLKGLPLDATDALAIAMTHIYETAKPIPASGHKSWKDFVAQNPGRVTGS